MTSRRTRLGALAIAAGLLFAACGNGTVDEASQGELASIASSTTAPATADTPSAPVDQDEAFARFSACMAEHGVAVNFGTGGGAPVPGETPDDVSSDPISPEKVEEADAECSPILEESFGSFDLDPEQEAEMADQMLSLQLCLADEGYEIEINGNGFSPGQVSDMDEFNAALDQCGREIGLGIGPGSDS